MTDKPEPPAEHIDAVPIGHVNALARVMMTRPTCEHEARYVGNSHEFYNCQSHDAEAVLTSTDPAVHAAQAANLPTDVMLTALVERGALSEEEWAVKCLCGKTLRGTPNEVEAWTREHDDSPKASHIVVWSPPSVKPWTRRLVTQWEPTP